MYHNLFVCVCVCVCACVCYFEEKALEAFADINFRSNYQRHSIDIDILKNFTKFAGKHVCQNLFFKVARVVNIKLGFTD